MTHVRTGLTIAAPPERVWAVLTDFAAYSQWNDVLTGVRGQLHVGGGIRFHITVEASPTLPIAARIVRCDPARELAWRGGAPLVPALAWGEHWFRLSPIAGGTELAHGEDFGGLLGLAVRGATHARITRTYEALNRALKARAEAPRPWLS